MIVTCYTPGTLYEAEATRLIASAGRIGMGVYTQAYKSLGDWHANVAYKATFLRHLRREMDGPILYVDADAVIHSDPWPELNRSLWAADIACRIRMGRILSGTILIRDSDKAMAVLDRWCEINEDDPKPTGKGQRNLQQALLDLQASAQIKTEADPVPQWPPIFQELPVSMCYIFDTDAMESPDVQPVIEHLQASREADGAVHSDEQRERRRARCLEIEAELNEAAALPQADNG